MTNKRDYTCPYCGGKVEIVGIKNGNSFIVWCENCGLGFGIEKEYYLYQIIGAWNHRAEQGQSEKVAELKRELERVKQERDAAVKDLDALRKKTGWKCDCCYYNDNYNRDVCTGCDYNSDNNWKWRGLKEE